MGAYKTLREKLISIEADLISVLDFAMKYTYIYIVENDIEYFYDVSDGIKQEF